jgi:hypothetical protein
MSPSIEAIYEKIKQDRFELSKHAVDQSIIRGIQILEIKEAIAQGQIIPNSGYLASIQFLPA